jgi:hypothetical protein
VNTAELVSIVGIFGATLVGAMWVVVAVLGSRLGQLDPDPIAGSWSSSRRHSASYRDRRVSARTLSQCSRW